MRETNEIASYLFSVITKCFSFHLFFRCAAPGELAKSVIMNIFIVPESLVLFQASISQISFSSHFLKIFSAS